MSDEPTPFPSAAQIVKNSAAVKAAVEEAIRAMNLRLKAVELAGHFPTESPVELAREIYSFLIGEEKP